MYCRNCGNKMEQGELVCRNCGSKEDVFRPFNILTPAQEMLKKAGTSTAYTIACVTQTLTVLIGVIFLVLVGVFGSFFIYDTVGSMISSYSYSEFSVYYGDIELLEAIALVLPVFAVVAGACVAVPGIINSVALWMIRKNAGSKNKPLKTTGLTILLGMNIISFSFYCIEVVMSIINTVFQFSAGAAGVLFTAGSLSSVVSAVLMGAVFLVTLCGYILGFIFYLKVFKTINAARKIIRNGDSAQKPSKFAAIYLIFESTVCILGAIAALVFIIPVGGTLAVIPFVICTVLFLLFVLYAIFYGSCAAVILKMLTRIDEIRSVTM